MNDFISFDFHPAIFNLQRAWLIVMASESREPVGADFSILTATKSLKSRRFCGFSGTKLPEE